VVGVMAMAPNRPCSSSKPVNKQREDMACFVDACHPWFVCGWTHLTIHALASAYHRLIVMAAYACGVVLVFLSTVCAADSSAHLTVR
jgi:hypothetical protein